MTRKYDEIFSKYEWVEYNWRGLYDKARTITEIYVDNWFCRVRRTKENGNSWVCGVDKFCWKRECDLIKKRPFKPNKKFINLLKKEEAIAERRGMYWHMMSLNKKILFEEWFGGRREPIQNKWWTLESHKSKVK